MRQMMKDTVHTLLEPLHKPQTMVSSIGVSPDVIIMPLKTLDAQGNGFSTDSALEYALANGADVVNLSLECLTIQWKEAAVDALVAAGVAVVAANGNDGLQQMESSTLQPNRLRFLRRIIKVSLPTIPMLGHKLT